MSKGFAQGAQAMGGSALTGARALGGGLATGATAMGSGMASAGKATAASLGRGYEAVSTSAPVVSTASALQKQTFDLKMKTGTLISIFMLLVFYISVSALGINVFNKCPAAQNSKKWQNIKGYFSHTLAMAIGVVVTLFTIQMFTAELSAFYVIFSLMGLVGSAMLMAMVKECQPSDKAGKTAYAGIAIAVNSVMLLGCLYMLTKGKKITQKALQGPLTANGLAPQLV